MAVARGNGLCNLCDMVSQKKPPGGQRPDTWPMKSTALACHKKQVGAMNARNQKHGIAAHYEADGTCVIQDRAARAKLIQKEGFFDNSGGYGDTSSADYFPPAGD